MLIFRKYKLKDTIEIFASSKNQFGINKMKIRNWLFLTIFVWLSVISSENACAQQNVSAATLNGVIKDSMGPSLTASNISV